jgi:hypothetical protein
MALRSVYRYDLIPTYQYNVKLHTKATFEPNVLIKGSNDDPVVELRRYVCSNINLVKTPKVTHQVVIVVAVQSPVAGHVIRR